MKNLLAATFLTAAILFPSMVRAMEIQKCDKMADADQAEYLGDLVVGAIKVLKDDGKPDLAEKVSKLFTEIHPGDKVSLGMAELWENLAAAKVAEIKRQARNPSLRHLLVEDAFKATVEDHGITLPEAFNSVGSNFNPKHPPKDKK